MVFEEALRGLLAELGRRGVRYMMIGGFANLFWGEPRTTLDLDLTVQTDDATLVEAASSIGTILVGDARSFLARTRVLPVRMADGTRVDLIAATLPFEIEAISRAREVLVGDLRVSICAPEDLVLHKVVSPRPRDLEDIVGVLRRQQGTLELEQLEADVGELAAALSMPEILERFHDAVRRARGT